jgi:hypothetical protein
MKRLLLLLFSFTLFAQDYGNDAEALELCTTLQSNSFSSDLDADNALDRILSVVGLSKNFVLSPCSNINNAVAVSYKGVRYILYDPEFMSMLSSNTSNWTNLFILAHEVGHHVNGHSLDLVLYAGDIVDAPELEMKRQQELEADEFAGFVLAKLGASLTQTTSSVSELSNEDDTYSTHPKRDKRVASIEKGWNRGYVKRVNKKTEILGEIDIKSFKTYSWEYTFKDERVKKSEINNPIDKVVENKNFNAKVSLTTSAKANLLEDKTSTWAYKLPPSIIKSPPKIIVEQYTYPNWTSYMGKKYKKITEEIFIEGLADLEMIRQHFLNDTSFKENHYKISLVLDFVIDDSSYQVLGRVNEERKSYSDENWVLKQLGGLKRFQIKFQGSYGSSYQFLEALKKGNKLFFRINRASISDVRQSQEFVNIALMYNDNTGAEYNTYYIDLKGSSRALDFKP